MTERVARARSRLIATPRTTAGRVCRGVAAIALGIFVVASPALAIQILAVAAGALLLFFGASELLGVIQSPERRAERASPSRRGLAFAGGAVAVFLVVGIALVALIGDDEDPRGPIDPEKIAECNGAAELCDRRLNEITFPGTHNSMSAADDRGWLFANQRHDISTQLEDGIRVLLIDPHYGVEDGSKVRTDLVKEGTDRNRIAKAIGEDGLSAAEDLFGELGRGSLAGERVPYLCHSVCELGATKMATALGDVRDFLDDNRYEVVILFVEPSIEPEEIDAVFRQAGLLSYVATLERYEPLPTLREMIASNRRLVVFTERDGGDPAWYHEGFSFTQDTEVGAELDECIGRNGNASSPLMMVNHWVDGFPPPVEANEKVTTLDALLERAQSCKRELGRVPNLFPVDQYDRGKIVEAAEQLNGLAAGDGPVADDSGS